MKALSPQRWLLPVALLLPLLAQADALSSLGFAYAVLAGLAFFAAFVLGLIVAAYLRPQWRWLYWAQLVLFLWSLVIGLGLERISIQSPGTEWGFFGHINPFWQLCLPLGAWLNSINWARRALTDTFRLLWVGVAVFALHYLLMLAPSEGLSSHFRDGGQYSSGLQAGYLLASIALGLASWWVVLRQLQPSGYGFLWQPWWRAPAVVAAVGLAFFGVFALVRFGHDEHYGPSFADLWPGMVWGELQGLALTWLTGVAALRLIAPPVVAPVASDTTRLG